MDETLWLDGDEGAGGGEFAENFLEDAEKEGEAAENVRCSVWERLNLGKRVKQASGDEGSQKVVVVAEGDERKVVLAERGFGRHLNALFESVNSMFFLF